MKEKYDFDSIESKWQRIWSETLDDYNLYYLKDVDSDSNTIKILL